jgi:uncharacterized protein (DUF305 family)
MPAGVGAAYRRYWWGRAARLLPFVLLTPLCTIAAQATSGAGAGGGPDSADVAFMQGMIAHHAQALAMVALIHDHTTRPELQLIGQRIRISQQDEIAWMQHWLQNRHQTVPTIDSNDVAHMVGAPMPGMQMTGTTMMMPGMMTPQQMTALAQATGPAFDRLFLEGMIRHHEGAIAMVKDLLATPGAAQAPEVFTFASDADADQRAEIKRMRTVLDALTSGAGKS